MSNKKVVLKEAITQLKKVRPLLRGRKREEIGRVIKALEEEANAANKSNRTNWIYVARLMLLATEIIRYFSD